jgi:hypothetical protein
MECLLSFGSKYHPTPYFLSKHMKIKTYRIAILPAGFVLVKFDIYIRMRVLKEGCSGRCSGLRGRK